MAEYRKYLPKISGSLEPMEGRCGRMLRGYDEEGRRRYCRRKPLKGKTICWRCNRTARSGPANKNYKTGKYAKGRFESVLPPGIRKHLNPKYARDAASCLQQLLLVDARTSEVLETIRDANPTGYVENAQVAISLMRLCLSGGDTDGSKAALQRLENLLDQQRMVAQGWDELHKLFDTRTKLARQETSYQKMLNETVMVGQISTFLDAIVHEVRMLSDDPLKITAYVNRVRALSVGMVAAPIIDAEIVNEEEEK